jgi:hypothetical protein
MIYEDKKVSDKPVKPVTTYHEKKIGRTLYRVTSVYKGEFELGKALEDLTIRKILRAENTVAGCGV